MQFINHNNETYVVKRVTSLDYFMRNKDKIIEKYPTYEIITNQVNVMLCEKSTIVEYNESPAKEKTTKQNRLSSKEKKSQDK